MQKFWILSEKLIFVAYRKYKNARTLPTLPVFPSLIECNTNDVRHNETYKMAT
jgi:hypothetical protein